MTLILVLAPLSGLFVVPWIRQHWSPWPGLNARLANPWAAWAGLTAANLLILLLTFGLFYSLQTVALLGLYLPALIGPLLSYACWTAAGMALPLRGGRRWAVAFGGMAPYLGVVAAAWTWLLNRPTTPYDDDFMAFIGGVLLTVVCLGAMLLGGLITGLTRHREP